MNERWKYNLFILIFVFTLIPAISYGQEGVGLPFLKIGVGARQAGLGGVFTGVGDDIYTLYWNPGGLGHIRRWQWSAAYNRWFTDIHQANVSYVKQFRMLGSRKSSLGLSCNYIGMPSWDATGGKESPVSAGHFVIGFSLGQRLNWLDESLALGVNVKVISSRFDTYSARGLATDVGLLLKPDRFELGSLGLGIFDYGIFSSGFSLLHLGTKMKFDNEVSSLPLTWRAGISLKMGRYDGWSLLLASDLIGVQDRDLVVGLGTEVWWKDVLAARMGYRANGQDLGDLSFGFGIRWDDVMNSLLGLPSRFGDAFEVDVADVGYGDVLQQTYRGALTHYPVAPESFRMEEPQVVSSRIMGESSTVTLNWENAFDPDPFDEVGYYLFIDKNHAEIEKAIQRIERDMEGFLDSPLSDSLLVCRAVPTTSFVTSVAEGGVYFWAVAAYDLAKHVQLAKRGVEKVGRFVVATYDLAIREFDFTPTPWITVTPEQGTLSFVVGNEGVAVSDGFRFVVLDSLIDVKTPVNTGWTTVLNVEIPRMAAGEDTTIQCPWETEHTGVHIIRAIVHPNLGVLEFQRENNVLQERVVSVPKGVLLAPDTVEVMSTEYDSTEIPVVPEVYFDTLSSQVDSIYYTDRSDLPSILRTLTKRLKENPDITLQVMGSIDALSGEEDPVLAEERAENVKNRLLALGVPASQVVVNNNHPSKILGRRRRPVDPQDAEWVMEQNRVVTFNVAQEDEATIFGPHRVAVDTTIRQGIPFDIAMESPGGVQNWRLRGGPRPIEMTREELASGDSLKGRLLWYGSDRNDVPVPRNRQYGYSLNLNDNLGRHFMTRPDSIYLKERMTIRRREIFGAAKFAQVEPVYQFYWTRLMNLAEELVQNSDMRITFEGHACAIGSDEVNERLSLQRALRFTDAFKDRIRETYPESYRDIWKRIALPVGFGEKDPLRLKLKGQQEILLGDNNSPIGRYLNRRIMVLLYRIH